MAGSAIEELRKQLPQLRSLLLLQEHLMRGTFATRHLDALERDGASIGKYVAIMECTHRLQQQRQAWGNQTTPSKLRALQTKNMACLGQAVCPEETHAWLVCMRRAVKAARALDSGEPLPDGAGGGTVNCFTRKRALETCAHRQSSALLFAAALPGERRDVALALPGE